MPIVRLALALVLLFLLAPVALAQEPVPTPTPTPTPTPAPEEPRIAPAVSAAGVDLSNLTVAEAGAKLHAELDAALAAPVTVSVAGRQATFKPARAGFAFDAERTARRAYYAGRDRTDAGPTAVELAISFARTPIKNFAKRLKRRVHIRPRNAKLRITLTRMVTSPAKAGRVLRVGVLRRRLERVLPDPAADRVVKPGRKVKPPKRRMRDLRRRYPTVLTIDKSSFALRLFERLRWKKTYGVAVGLPDYPTPSGRFSIANKVVNPTWTAPNSPWAGEMAGQSVSGGDPNNPLKARWMGIVNGVGIHGTGQEWSIGSRASHGCIRMRVADVIDLYPRVPVGTTVLIR